MQVTTSENMGASHKAVAKRGLSWWLRELASVSFWLLMVSILAGCPVWARLATSLSTITGQGLLVVTLTVFGLVWLFCGNKAIWFSLFVTIYPLVIAFRVLPRLFAKHWPILVIFLPGVRSILVTFRRRVAVGAIALAACIVSLTSNNHTALTISWWMLVGYLVWHYAQRFVHTYQSTTVYSQLATMLEVTASWLPDPKKLRAQFQEQREANKTDRKKDASEYLVFYAGSTALHYIAEKLNRLHKSSKIDLYLVTSAVCTVLLNIAVFAVIFYSVSRYSAGQFQVPQDAGLLDFLSFSFCNHFMSDVSSISPALGLARLFCIVQQIFAVFAALLVGLVFFTSCRERHARDLELVVKKFENASNAIGEVFEHDFCMTLSAVEGLLLSLTPDMARWLIKVRYGEVRANKRIKDFDAEKIREGNVIDIRATEEHIPPINQSSNNSSTAKKIRPRKRKPKEK